MARPKFVATEEQRRAVKTLAAYGLRPETIARKLGFRSAKTLRKYFKEEIEDGAAGGLTRVYQTRYQMATSGKHPSVTQDYISQMGAVRFKLLRTTTVAEIAAAMDAILQEMADGQLTPAEGQTIIESLASRLKVIEAVDHEARICALESEADAAPGDRGLIFLENADEDSE